MLFKYYEMYRFCLKSKFSAVILDDIICQCTFDYLNLFKFHLNKKRLK